MIDARAFANDWIESWNSHDLDRILSHYHAQAELLSPVAAQRTGHGRVKGHAALRSYWAPALSSGSTLRFTLRDLFAGYSSLTVVYDAVLPADLGDRRGAETFELNSDGLVVRSMACYLREDRA